MAMNGLDAGEDVEEYEIDEKRVIQNDWLMHFDCPIVFFLNTKLKLYKKTKFFVSNRI